MEIDIFESKENWQGIKDSALNTIGKTTGKYLSSKWKKGMLLAEHSPIRRISM